jgi:hypothetical protein
VGIDWQMTEYSLGPLIPFWRGGLSVSNMEREEDSTSGSGCRGSDGNEQHNDHRSQWRWKKSTTEPRGGPSPAQAVPQQNIGYLEGEERTVTSRNSSRG